MILRVVVVPVSRSVSVYNKMIYSDDIAGSCFYNVDNVTHIIHDNNQACEEW